MSVLLRLKESFAKKSKMYYFLTGVITVVGLLFVSTNLFFTHNTIALTDGNLGELFPQDYKIISPKIPNNITIFGEGVPLENFEVYERADREI